MRQRHREGRRPGIILFAFILIAALLATSPGLSPRAVAQDATPEDATPVAIEPGAMATPAADAEPGSFAAFGYDDVTARGMHATVTYNFPLPLAASFPEGGSVELEYSHSPLLVEELSTMTVMANGQSLESVRLTEETAEGGHLSVALPPVEGEASSIALTLAFHLRLTQETCEIPDDPAQWVTIHKTSSISLPEGAGNVDLHLSDAPALLRRNAEEQESGPVIVMPEQPSAEELSAAGVVSYHTGRWSGQSNDPAIVGEVASDAPSSDEAAILVGVGSSLPIEGDWGGLEWDGEALVLNGTPVPDEHGVLAIRQQPVPQILVSGASPAAVQLAANALSRPMDWQLFDASAVVITGELPDANQGRYAWEQEAASFAQLGEYRRDVVGPGEHYIDLSFDRPADWELHDDSTLQLDLDVSPAVRSETSWVRVSVNGQDIGTQQIRDEGEGVQRYEFDLPADRLTTDLDGQPVRTLSVQVRVFLDYPHEACESIDPRSAWAVLMPTSSWLLPHSEYDGQDIGRFPAGFSSVDEPVDLTVVLPDDPTAEELRSALQVSAAMGRWNAWTSAAAPELRIAGTLSEEDLEDRSAILIGGPERNTLASELDVDVETLAQPALQGAPGDTYGLLALASSPWSDDDHALLVAGSGSEGDGTLIAARALGDGEALSSMQGTRIAVTQNPAPVMIEGANPPNEAPSSLAPQILPDERPWIERIEAWQIVGGIVLISILALILGVIQLRWIRGGKR